MAFGKIRSRINLMNIDQRITSPQDLIDAYLFGISKIHVINESIKILFQRHLDILSGAVITAPEHWIILFQLLDKFISGEVYMAGSVNISIGRKTQACLRMEVLWELMIRFGFDYF